VKTWEKNRTVKSALFAATVRQLGVLLWEKKPLLTIPKKRDMDTSNQEEISTKAMKHTIL
jgi:hypothetical protein